MDRSDLYQQSSRERVNGFRDSEQPSSQDQRETPEADPDAANPNDSVDKNQGLGSPDSIQGGDQRPQPNAGASNGNNSMTEDSVGTGASTDQQQQPEGVTTGGPDEEAAAEEEQHDYAPGFPKKMEVVVLALVRQTEDMDSDWVTELPKGTIVQVVEIVGRRARITHPFPGWLSIRTGDGVTILTEPDGTVRVGARIVYKDFVKKASIHGTVIDKDDRRSLHLVQFVDGRKEWLNLNCKEVEIVSTGRGEDITPQVSGATRLNYFAEIFTPQTRGSDGRSGGGRGGESMGGGSGMGDSLGASPPHGSGPPNRMGNGYPPSSHAPNGSARGSRHRYEDPYGHRPPHGRGGVPDRAVDPRYPGAPYNRGSSSWGMRGHDGAPPGLQGQGPSGHMGMNGRRGGGGGGGGSGYYDDYGGGGNGMDHRYPMDHRGPPPPEMDDYEERRQHAESSGPGPIADMAAREPAESRSNVKGFIVLRGLPGAGKTTLAKKLASRAPQSRICTEDRYHWTSGEDGVGEYKFKREVLFFARDWCNKEVKNSVRMGIDLVILDNCNARISMYEDLINHAVRHKYRFRIIEFIATPELVDRYAARSLKGFPREVYLKLLKLWERDPRAELINPCFDDDDGPQAAPAPPAPAPQPSGGPPVVGPPPPLGPPGGLGPMPPRPRRGDPRDPRDPRDAPPYYTDNTARGTAPGMFGQPPAPGMAHHSSHRHHGHGGVPYDSGDHGDYMQHYY